MEESKQVALARIFMSVKEDEDGLELDMLSAYSRFLEETVSQEDLAIITGMLTEVADFISVAIEEKINTEEE